MELADLQAAIEDLYEAGGTPADPAPVEEAISLLDRGEVRVSEPAPGADPEADEDWIVNEWLKKAILLFFRIRGMERTDAGPMEFHDKLPLKHDYTAQDVKVAPPGVARYGSYLSPGVILMPSYVNIGAHVGPGTLVDTWATVGSCAQVGANVHLSGGVGLGGVLEPVQGKPVVIEDGAFIGSRCIVVEGVRVGKEAVLGAGLILTATTPVIDVTGKEPVEYRGRVPARAIVVQGMRPRDFPAGHYALPAGLIISYRTQAHGDRLQLEQTLRDFGGLEGV